jgi:biotin carboxyl carrier protein
MIMMMCDDTLDKYGSHTETVYCEECQKQHTITHYVKVINETKCEYGKLHKETIEITKKEFDKAILKILAKMTIILMITMCIGEFILLLPGIIRFKRKLKYAKTFKYGFDAPSKVTSIHTIPGDYLDEDEPICTVYDINGDNKQHTFKSPMRGWVYRVKIKEKQLVHKHEALIIMLPPGC